MAAPGVWQRQATTTLCTAAGNPELCALHPAANALEAVTSPTLACLCLACPPPVTQIEAVYHTSIVVAGSEYYFGGGINVARAGHTPFGRPIQVGGAWPGACIGSASHHLLCRLGCCAGLSGPDEAAPLASCISVDCSDRLVLRVAHHRCLFWCAGAGPGPHAAARGCARGATRRPERALHTR